MEVGALGPGKRQIYQVGEDSRPQSLEGTGAEESERSSQTGPSGAPSRAGDKPPRAVGGRPSSRNCVPQTAQPHLSRAPSAHRSTGRPLRTGFASGTCLALVSSSTAAATAARARANPKGKRSNYPPYPGGSGSDVKREGRRALVTPFPPASTSSVCRGGARGELLSSARAAPGRDVAVEG